MATAVFVLTGKNYVLTFTGATIPAVLAFLWLTAVSIKKKVLTDCNIVKYNIALVFKGANLKCIAVVSFSLKLSI